MVVRAGLAIYDDHIEYLQTPSQWQLSQSEYFHTDLTRIIIQTAQLDTIHFTFKNTNCLNGLFSALGKIKCGGKWQYLCPAQSAVLKHAARVWQSPREGFVMAGEAARSGMDGSSSAGYTTSVPANRLHMKSPACPPLCSGRRFWPHLHGWVMNDSGVIRAHSARLSGTWTASTGSLSKVSGFP